MTYSEETERWTHLLLHLHILKDGVHSPCLRKHGSKRCGVPHDENPGADLHHNRDVRRHLLAEGHRVCVLFFSK